MDAIIIIIMIVRLPNCMFRKMIVTMLRNYVVIKIIL
ncbi:hypothetical protein PFHG_05259 [Plasmodium falciparum HB3]|uniref:Uncharacterized protein n=1 Tax=Plasmodium falciparum (isolate HB3) TaxID=137071 RepID=A0A0L7KJI0_PLAFX|nr:hypothetical protein PFHG_05259 [Plasmodium falciparum HB3]